MLREALERLDRPDRMLIEADLTCEFAPAAVAQSAFDAVLALDVIEHIDDDAAVLANLGRLVSQLDARRMGEVCAALAFALGCDG